MPSDSSHTNSGAAARFFSAESGSMTPSSAAMPPAHRTGPATSPSRAMSRGTRPDRYISQPRISPFPTPRMKPGPSRNVQSWIATSDLPTVTKAPASPPAGGDIPERGAAAHVPAEAESADGHADEEPVEAAGDGEHEHRQAVHD